MMIRSCLTLLLSIIVWTVMSAPPALAACTWKKTLFTASAKICDGVGNSLQNPGCEEFYGGVTTGDPCDISLSGQNCKIHAYDDPWGTGCDGEPVRFGSVTRLTCQCTAENGSCGTSNGGTFPNATPPSTNLCGAGAATAVTTNPSTYTWSCNGSGGGTNASCSATRSPPATVIGLCGPADRAPHSTAPAFGLCRSGTPSAISGSGPWTWSCNGSGGGVSQSCSATTIGGSCSASKVSSKDHATCAITANGGVKCWGFGFGTTPTTIAGLSNVIQIKSGPFTLCTIHNDGAINCWSPHGGGMFSGTSVPTPLPSLVGGPVPNDIIDIEIGNSHACVQTISGSAKCWGNNFFSQLGDGTTTNRNAPVDVQGMTSGVAAVATNWIETSSSGCGLSTAGGMKCWGLNNAQQVGDGTGTRRNSPVDVSGLESGVRDLAAGMASNCAVTDAGDVKCWGHSGWWSASPTDISNSSGFRKLSGGGPVPTYCGLTSGGAVKCFGSDFTGNLGDGGSSPSDSYNAAVDVVGLGGGVVDVSTARGWTSTHSCAVLSTGSMKCWGSNSSGELGTGSTTPSIAYEPVDVKLCPINGSCGAANGVGVASAPSSNLCTTGTATAVSGSGPFTWSCNGSGGGTNAACSAPLQINGACGSANGGAFYVPPAVNLCFAGFSSSVSGSGPYTWTCTGANGGTNANCSALRKFDGVCGTANGVGDENTPTALCSTGAPSAVSTVGTNWNWSCAGVNGGNPSACSAPRIYHGMCGPSNGTNVYAKPSSGLCAVGNATSVGGTGPFSWNCNGINGGTNASCSANLSVNGECGPANGGSSLLAPTTGLCSAGTAGAISGTGPFIWNCGGLNGGTSIGCSSLAIVNGACGVSNNTPTATAPVAGLCSSGTPTAVTGAGPWSWRCTGANGGLAANCTAPTPPAPPSFGGACPVAP